MIHICLWPIHADVWQKTTKFCKAIILQLKNKKTKKLRSWHLVPLLHGRDGKTMKTVKDFIFLGSKIAVDGDRSHEIKRCLLLGRKALTNLDSILRGRDITFVSKGPSSQGYDFSSSHVWMWELDHKEGWAPKNGCFWTMGLEKILESPLDSTEIKLVNPKQNQP